LKQNEKVKIVELFAGIGSQYKALKNINVPVEVVGISEWDINCLISYNHIHHTPTEITLTKEEIIEKLKDFTFSNNTKTKCELSKLPLKKLRLLYDAHINNKNLGSVVDLNGINMPQHDLLTYSFPCQDLSIQGKKKGLYAGERSSLLWQVGRILTELKGLDKLPNYLLMENVPGIYSEQNKAGFDDWKKMLTDLGYTNYDFKLRSTYFDVPQSRDRVYMVSTLLGHYDVPKEVNFTTKTIKDILDLNDERWLDFTGFLPEPIVFRTSRNNIKKFDLIGKYKFETLGRIYSQDDVSPTLTTGIAGKVYIDGKIRFLNGRECYKLMGFTDQDVDNVLKVFDEGTLVKQAGNSIVVNVLEGIFTNLFKNNGN